MGKFSLPTKEGMGFVFAASQSWHALLGCRYCWCAMRPRPCAIRLCWWVCALRLRDGNCNVMLLLQWEIKVGWRADGIGQAVSMGTGPLLTVRRMVRQKACRSVGQLSARPLALMTGKILVQNWQSVRPSGYANHNPVKVWGNGTMQQALIALVPALLAAYGPISVWCKVESPSKAARIVGMIGAEYEFVTRLKTTSGCLT